MITHQIDSVLKFKKLEDFMELPVVVTVNKFTEDSAKTFREDMNKAMNSNKSIIPVVIDSYGGQAYALLSMIDQVKRVQQEGYTVATISTGKSMSCGALLFSMGSEGHRYIDKYSTLMIHEVSSGCHGKIEELKVDVKEAERLNKQVFYMMAENVGKPKNYFLDIVHDKNHADWYLDSSECLTHNLANYIGYPKFDIKITVDISFVL